MSTTAYIAFGSNVGDLRANYALAQKKLNSQSGVTINRASSLYLTEPLTSSAERQSWYLNGVFEVETTLSPHQLLISLKDIEQAMGRRPHERWSARICDLDILFYGDLVHHDNRLRIPHEHLQARRFVLKPLSDLIPNFVHPEVGLSVKDILASCNDPLAIKPFSGPTCS